jgi:c-di-GMP-binding flagellar brake protein YcgR
MDAKQSDSEQGTPSAEGIAVERRAHPRAKGWGTAWIGVFPEGTKAISYLLDLGLGGCRVEADEAIPATDHANVEVLLHLEGYTLLLAGVIRHQEENNTKAGIEFIDVNPRKAEKIQKLLDQLLAELE